MVFKAGRLCVTAPLYGCLLLGACTSAGKAQIPVDRQPFEVADARTGTAIPRVLIVPKYSVSTGVSTGAGHGPGYMTDSRFVASPIVYESGHPFTVPQPDSKGLIGPLGTIFIGRGVTLDGVMVVAPGYRGRWIWQLWERTPYEKIQLDRLGDAEADQQRRRMLALFAAPRIRGIDLTEPERDLFSVIKAFDIDVRFDSSERQLVRDFLTSSAK
jgi:hypothetical protein